MYYFIGYCDDIRKITVASRARKIVSIRQFWKHLKSNAHLFNSNVGVKLAYMLGR